MMRNAIPASTPKTSEKAINQHSEVGELIRLQRKSLGVTAIATSEAAGDL